MRELVLGVALLASLHGVAIARSCVHPREIAYEPQVVEFSGRLFIAHGRHPNGAALDYPVLRLATPVSVRADGVNRMNGDEACVREVQLVAADDALRHRLYRAAGRRVTVHGTVFHAHTAWHVRALLVNVAEAPAAAKTARVRP